MNFYTIMIKYLLIVIFSISNAWAVTINNRFTYSSQTPHWQDWVNKNPTADVKHFAYNDIQLVVTFPGTGTDKPKHYLTFAANITSVPVDMILTYTFEGCQISGRPLPLGLPKPGSLTTGVGGLINRIPGGFNPYLVGNEVTLGTVRKGSYGLTSGYSLDLYYYLISVWQVFWSAMPEGDLPLTCSYLIKSNGANYIRVTTRETLQIKYLGGITQGRAGFYPNHLNLTADARGHFNGATHLTVPSIAGGTLTFVSDHPISIDLGAGPSPASNHIETRFTGTGTATGEIRLIGDVSQNWTHDHQHQRDLRLHVIS